jgi:hypothetical protein
MDFWKDSHAGDSVVYYTRDYDYDIYKLTPHSFNAAYRFVFPAQISLPRAFRSDTAYDAKRQKFIKANRQLIFKIGNIYKSGDNLFFRTIDYNFSNLSYIYSERSKNVICVNRVVSDAKSYFLPITDAEVGGVDFVNRGIVQFDGAYGYSSYSSLLLFHQMEATKGKNPEYPSALKKYLSDKKNMKGNPVLIRFKFKPQL